MRTFGHSSVKRCREAGEAPYRALPRLLYLSCVPQAGASEAGSADPHAGAGSCDPHAGACPGSAAPQAEAKYLFAVIVLYLLYRLRVLPVRRPQYNKKIIRRKNVTFFLSGNKKVTVIVTI